ncbi:hypothetical protein SCARD494_13636 [Seiridium cardinale]
MCKTGSKTIFQGCRCVTFERSGEDSPYCNLGKYCHQLGGHVKLYHYTEQGKCPKCTRKAANPSSQVIGKRELVPKTKTPTESDMELVLREIEDQVTRQMQVNMTIGQTTDFLYFILSSPVWCLRRAVNAFGQEAGKYFQKPACDRLVKMATRRGFGPVLETAITQSREKTYRDWQEYHQKQERTQK